MKTAISIPDELFEAADALAEINGLTRSELYRRALADYVTRRRPGAVTESLNSMADHLAREHSGFNSEAANQTLRQSEW